MVKHSLFILVVFLYESTHGDPPCAARSVSGQSVICVCNATYCDYTTREMPASDGYVAYTSSEDGLRFNKTTGKLLTGHDIEGSIGTIQLNPNQQFQTIVGFGGAVTDAASLNWKNLSEPLQEYLVTSYFSQQGLSYNLIRVPMGSSDFSTHAYAYNELPANDTKLTNFSLSVEDIYYKIPLIKAGMLLAKQPIYVVASCWSPPLWMKTKQSYAGKSQLRPEYYQTYADYFYKFIEKYTAEGVPIWAITTTNEPSDGLIGITSVQDLGWTAETMNDWILNNLGPTIRNSIFNNTKILAVDDQRLLLFYWWNVMIEHEPGVLKYVDGAAVHYYTDMFTPAAEQVEAMRAYPDKFLINTEACEGTFPGQNHVEPGSWQRAYDYISDIITNLNHLSVGWLDWNICLDAGGGPNWSNNFADSPIIVHPELDEFHKQPMFYAMGHFSKFIPRGSVRIGSSMPTSLTSIEGVSVLTPENTVVVVIYNKGSASIVNIKLGNKLAAINCPQESVTTVELPYETSEI